MDWTERLVDLALGGVALTLGTDLVHVKKSALARLGEHNPMRSISANHDLLRALRLSWARAAMDILDHTLHRARQAAERATLAEVERFDQIARASIRRLRSAAFDRSADPGPSTIDDSLAAVLAGVPEFIGVGPNSGDSHNVGRAFAPTMAELTEWPVEELPPLLLQVAREGVMLNRHRGGGGEQRSFGELVFAEFADLIKDPEHYPQAGAAFAVAMNHALRGLAQDTLALVRGIDDRVDQALPQIDALKAMQEGALELMRVQFSAVRDDIAAVPEATVEVLMARLQADGALSGVERRTLIALAQRLTHDEVRDVDRAVKELEHAVEVAARVMARGEDDSHGDAFVARVLADVADHTRAGNIDRGGESVDDALAQLEREEVQQREERKQARRALIEAGVQQDLLRRDAYAVARRVETLAAIDAVGAPAAGEDFARRARAFYDEGESSSVNLSLQVAIEMAQRMRDAADSVKARRAALDLLADALKCLGDREAEPAHLQEAVALRREILAGIDRATEGLAWGAAQGALSAALNTLGWRVYDLAMLNESIAAQRAELEECTRGRDPMAWAAAQNRLGRALYTLGFREGDAGLLRSAVTAFDEALKERSRTREPKEWSRTQNLKGIALSMLGRVEGGTAMARLAVQAYREALKERDRVRAPVDWAACTSNLSLELMVLGEATADVALLDEAIRSLRAVLETRAREERPIDWAMTQHNLGGALTMKAEISGSATELEGAVQALRGALQEFDRVSTPVYWTASQSDLSTALMRLGRLRRDPALLQQAVDAARAALSVRDRAAAPLEWANSQVALARALHALAEIGQDAAAARAAAEAFECALSELNAERKPDEFASARDGLAAVRALL